MQITAFVYWQYPRIRDSNQKYHIPYATIREYCCIMRQPAQVVIESNKVYQVWGISERSGISHNIADNADRICDVRACRQPVVL